MGYILPINHEQYKQYADNQVNRNEERPFYIDPVIKSTIKSRLQEKKNESDEMLVDFKNHNQNKITSSTPSIDSNRPEQKRKEVLRDITGKGHFINKVI